tara:strand:- start:1149 stop:1370 length:222 start_codon:yes stop_codon:yes gene_type:complete
MSRDQMAIREAFSALCEYQNPSSSEERKQMSLIRCWQILAAAVQADRPAHEYVHDQLNNWSYGKEEELYDEGG